MLRQFGRGVRAGIANYQRTSALGLVGAATSKDPEVERALKTLGVALSRFEEAVANAFRNVEARAQRTAQTDRVAAGSLAAVRDDTDRLVLCEPGTSGVRIVLPAAAAENAGRRVIIKNASAAAGSINVSIATRGQTIDGAATDTFSGAWTSRTYMSTGSGWVVV